MFVMTPGLLTCSELAPPYDDIAACWDRQVHRERLVTPIPVWAHGPSW